LNGHHKNVRRRFAEIMLFDQSKIVFYHFIQSKFASYRTLLLTRLRESFAVNKDGGEKCARLCFYYLSEIVLILL
jgi:hypothetical protein